MTNPPQIEIATNLNRRQILRVGGMAALAGLAFTAPACPGDATKDEAVKVLGFAINLSKQAIPLLTLLGGQEIANLVSTKVIPALEKLKDVLEDVNIPESQSALATVRDVLDGVANALLQFPDSGRRTTILGILLSINALLLTVEAFVASEMPAAVGPMLAPGRQTKMNGAILRAFEATRP